MAAHDPWSTDYRYDLRRLRANGVANLIMTALRPFIVDAPEAYDALAKALHDAGIDLLTDAMRAEIGLAPRDERGWTADETRAYEYKRIEAMLAPISFPIKLDKDPAP